MARVRVPTALFSRAPRVPTPTEGPRNVPQAAAAFGRAPEAPGGTIVGGTRAPAPPRMPSEGVQDAPSPQLGKAFSVPPSAPSAGVANTDEPVADLPRPKAVQPLSSAAPPGHSAGPMPADLPGLRPDVAAGPNVDLSMMAGEVDLPAPKPATRRTLVSGGGVRVQDPPPVPDEVGSDVDEVSLGDLELEVDDEQLQSVDLPALKGGVASVSAPDCQDDLSFAVAPSDDGVGELDLPAPVKRAGEVAGMDAADLPAPKANSVAPSGAFGDLDLPVSVKRTGEGAAGMDAADLPAPKTDSAAPSGAFGEVDLPRPKRDNASVADLPRARRDSASVADLPRARRDSASVADLPRPRRASAGEVDLPRPRRDSASIADLPRPKGPAEGFGELDLPVPKPVSSEAFQEPGPDEDAFENLALDPPGFEPHESRDDANLPVAAGKPPDLPLPLNFEGFGELDLPLPARAVDAPAVASTTGRFLSLPPAEQGAEEASDGAPLEGFVLPTPLASAELVGKRARTVVGAGGLPPLPLAPPESGPPAVGGSGDEADFSDLDFDDAAQAAGELPRPLATARPSESMEPQSDEGSGYGEIELGDPLDRASAADEMEFGIDEEGAEDRDFALPPEVMRLRREEVPAEQPVAGGRKTLVMFGAVFGVVALLGLLGVGLGMFTHHGYFGVYFLERFLPEAGTPEFSRTSIERAEHAAASDTFSDVRRSLRLLGEARHKAGLNRALLSRSLLHESLAMLRFGDSSRAAARVAAIRRRLEERGGEAPGMALARAADAARRGRWNEFATFLRQARAQGSGDPYVELLAGEAALVQHDIQAAQPAYAAALQLGAGARAQWGLARVAALSGDAQAHKAAVEATLASSPRHAAALIAKARLLFQAGEVAAARQQLEIAIGHAPLSGEYLWPSPRARAVGASALGYVYETLGHLHLARQAYSAALEVDPRSVEALVGAGRVMLRERRFGDALARFEAAANALANGVDQPTMSGRPAIAEAMLGKGRALLALSRAVEAKKVLDSLAAELPKDPEVLEACGHAEETLKNPARAEELYRSAMELAPSSFRGYLALSQLYAQQGEVDKASEVLSEATLHVKETAEMRRLLGQAELARDRLARAAQEFRRALVLDPTDLEARFGLGQVLRRTGRFDEAASALAEVQRRDPTYAGLLMERGLLHEARGDYAAAIRSYRAALKEHPNEVQLLLRLGAAQVELGKLREAEQTLARVLRDMPNSAEAEYFIGRVAFARGRTPDALTHFDRALALDGAQGEFHLYAARAALEMGNLGRSLDEAQAAIERDRSLGDAFFVRGTVRLRMGAVRDALRDLYRAVQLNPNRTEAHAAIGESFEQMGRLEQAAEAYRTALKAAPRRADWWYRLSQVTADQGQIAPALSLVKKAIDLAEQEGAAEPPYWLPDAYRMAGDIARSNDDRDSAIEYYRRYMEIAPDGHVDRAAVQALLKRWGAAAPGDDSSF